MSDDIEEKRRELRIAAGWKFSAIEQPAREALEAVQKPALERMREACAHIKKEQDAIAKRLQELVDEATPIRERFEEEIREAADIYNRMTAGPLSVYQAECAAIDKGERDES